MRLGAFVSLAWAIGAGLWTYNNPPYSPQWQFYNHTCAYRGLSAPRPTDPEKEKCVALRSSIEAEGARENLVRTVFIVAIPIAVGWLLFLLASWAVAGFRQLL